MAVLEAEKESVCVTVTEAARRCSVCTATIRRAIKRQELKAFKLNTKGNGNYRIPVTELEKLFAGK